MKSKKPPLSLVPTVVPDRELDFDEVRANLVRGSNALLSSLFTQAEFEYTRIEKLRGLLSFVEDKLFGEDLNKLSPEQRIMLYNLASRNMTAALTFLQNLHPKVITSIDAINEIEKLKKKDDPRESIKIDATVEQVKALIKQKIKEKIANT